MFSQSKILNSASFENERYGGQRVKEKEIVWGEVGRAGILNSFSLIDFLYMTSQIVWRLARVKCIKLESRMTPITDYKSDLREHELGNSPETVMNWFNMTWSCNWRCCCSQGQAWRGGGWSALVVNQEPTVEIKGLIFNKRSKRIHYLNCLTINFSCL